MTNGRGFSETVTCRNHLDVTADGNPARLRTNQGPPCRGGHPKPHAHASGHCTPRAAKVLFQVLHFQQLQVALRPTS